MDKEHLKGPMVRRRLGVVDTDKFGNAHAILIGAKQAGSRLSTTSPSSVSGLGAYLGRLRRGPSKGSGTFIRSASGPSLALRQCMMAGPGPIVSLASADKPLVRRQAAGQATSRTR